jgi:hypothetical protein
MSPLAFSGTVPLAKGYLHDLRPVRRNCPSACPTAYLPICLPSDLRAPRSRAVQIKASHRLPCARHFHAPRSLPAAFLKSDSLRFTTVMFSPICDSRAIHLCNIRGFERAGPIPKPKEKVYANGSRQPPDREAGSQPITLSFNKRFSSEGGWEAICSPLRIERARERSLL